MLHDNAVLIFGGIIVLVFVFGEAVHWMNFHDTYGFWPWEV